MPNFERLKNVGGQAMLRITQIFLCIFIFGFFLFCYLDRQNKVTALQLKIPKVIKECEQIAQENQSLKAKINLFEQPMQLMSFLDEKNFAHLSFYVEEDIVCLKEQPPLKKDEKIEKVCRSTPGISIATGVSHP